MNDNSTTFTNTLTMPEAGDQPGGLRPLTICLQRLDQTKNGYWRPGAFVKVTETLRTSGFLQALPAEDVKNLLFLLSFVTPNGHCQASALQLGEAMQVSQMKVRSRMKRLERFEWQGLPVVIALPSESGLDSYCIAQHLLTMEEDETPPPDSTATPLIAVPREAVIRYSRERYSRPRAEVERLIAEQNGWEMPDEQADAPEATVRRRLLAVGVSREQVDFLLANYDVERIEQQLDWLPRRNARVPAHFVVAAIEHDYEEPFDLRIRRLTGEAESGDEVGSDNEDGSGSRSAHERREEQP